MTTRKLIIQELEQVPGAILRAVLDFLRFLKGKQSPANVDKPFLQSAGILSDDGVSELQATIESEFEGVNLDEW